MSIFGYAGIAAPPTPPPGTSSLTYSWTLPTDPATGTTDTTITSQTVYWDTVSRTPFGGYSDSHVISDGTTTSYVIPSLVAGTPYYIVNTVTNANGESAYSQETTATPP